MSMIHIVGVGPAGASLAYYLKDEFKVRGYEIGNHLEQNPVLGQFQEV